MRHAFLYSNGQLTDLTPSWTSNSYALALNNGGQMVGYVDDGSPTFRPTAALFGNGGVTPLTTNGELSYATGINQQGQIVGLTVPAGAQTLGFVYHNGTLTTLNEPGASGHTSSIAINDSGKIAFTRDAQSYVYQNGSYTPFDSPGGPGSPSYVVAINAGGDVIGNFRPKFEPDVFETNQHVFLFKNGASVDLKTGYVGYMYSDGRAGAINDLGQIVGRADFCVFRRT